MALRDGETNAASQLREAVGKVRRHAWILVLAAVIAGGLAAYYTRQQISTYSSEAKVLVKSPNLAPATSGAGFVNMATETQIAESAAVARVASDDLEGAGGGIAVQNPPGTDILSFAYTSPSRRHAVSGAQAYAEAYLEFRREKAAQELIDILRLVNERIEDARTQLREVNEQLAVAETSSERLTLEAQANAFAQEIQGLRAQLASYSAPDALQAGYVVEDATFAVENAPPVRRNALAAVLLGLGLGAAIALIRERYDVRVRSGADLRAGSGLDVLATIPSVTGLARGNSRALPSLMQPTGGAAEAYRHLAANLLFAASSSDYRTILVTSADPGEGKSVVSANLAVSLAKSHKEVILVCADMRDPSQHELFFAANEIGLTSVLQMESGPVEGIVRTGVNGLRLLPSGPPVQEPSHLLSSERVTFLLQELRDEADLIILDCPPVLPVADTLLLASKVDGVLLVAESGRTRADALRAACAHLDQVGANIVGTVLNRSNDATTSAYGKYPVVDRTHGVHPALAEIVDLDRRDSK